MRTLLALAVLMLCSCASREAPVLPGAFLVVDGRKYEMTAGTFCWKDLCNDSFAYTTEIKPVEIDKNSKLEIYLKSSSALQELYLESVDPHYFSPTKLPLEDSDSGNKDFAQQFNNRYVIWEADLDSAEHATKLQDASRKKLKSSMRQSIENTYGRGKYIISIESRWADGYGFFNILVETKR